MISGSVQFLPIMCLMWLFSRALGSRAMPPLYKRNGSQVRDTRAHVNRATAGNALSPRIRAGSLTHPLGRFKEQIRPFGRGLGQASTCRVRAFPNTAPPARKGTDPARDEVRIRPPPANSPCLAQTEPSNANQGPGSCPGDTSYPLTSKLLIRARRFSTILVDGDPVPFAALAKRE